MTLGEREDGKDGYNERLGKLPKYRLFHSHNVHLPASRGPIEFCDLFDEVNCDLIHIKRFAKSSQLSHLFQQGTNSARLFRTSAMFRKELRATIKDDDKLATRLAKEPGQREYRVIFAISSSSPNRLELPLFSKLSLRLAFSELAGLGFRTAVAKIAVPKDERELQKPRPQKGKEIRKTF
jgi:uncharacterized protein (TIGR04141 family)